MIYQTSDDVKDFHKKNLEDVLLSFCKENPDRDKVEKCWEYFCKDKVGFYSLPLIPIHLKGDFSYKDAIIYSLYYYRTIGKAKRTDDSPDEELLYSSFKDSLRTVIQKYFPFINKQHLSGTNKKLFDADLIGSTKSPFYVFPPTGVKINKHKHYMSMPTFLLLLPTYVLSYRERFVLADLYTLRLKYKKCCEWVNKGGRLEYVGIHAKDQKIYKKLEKMELISIKGKDIYILPRKNIKRDNGGFPLNQYQIMEQGFEQAEEENDYLYSSEDYKDWTMPQTMRN